MIRHLLSKHSLVIALIPTAITIAGSLLSSESLENTGISGFPGLDKIVHFVMYMVLGFVWHNRFLKSPNAIITTVLGLFILGMVLELCQFYFLPGRFFEIPDIIANIMGSLVGIYILKYIYPNLEAD